MLDKASAEKVAKRLPDKVTLKDKEIALAYASAVEAGKQIASAYADYLAGMKKITERYAALGAEPQHQFTTVDEQSAFWEKHKEKLYKKGFFPIENRDPDLNPESNYSRQILLTFEEMSKAGVTPEYLERILTLEAEKTGILTEWRQRLASATNDELKAMGKLIWPQVIEYRDKNYPITPRNSGIYANSLDTGHKTRYGNSPEFYNAVTDSFLWHAMHYDWKSEMKRRKLKAGRLV